MAKGSAARTRTTILSHSGEPALAAEEGLTVQGGDRDIGSVLWLARIRGRNEVAISAASAANGAATSGRVATTPIPAAAKAEHAATPMAVP